MTTSIPSASNAAASSSPAKGSSRASSRRDPSTTVTSSHPRRLNAWAISAPMAPPPSTSSRLGSCFAAVMARLSHARTSASPGIGGMTALVPVARTTAFVASSRWASPAGPSTSTARSPTRRPSPRTRAIPFSASHVT